MKITIGPETRALAVKYFSRFGVWPPGLLTILRGAPVPPELIAQGVIARAKEKRDQEIRDARPSGLLPEEE